MSKKVTDGSKVTVHYVGKLEDGVEFDNSYTRNMPLTFEIGSNQMIPGFEQAVLNREVNEKFDVTIPKDQAYGEYSENRVQTIDRKQLGEINEDVQIGSQLQGVMPNGEQFLCILKDLNEQTATLDLNHPLAGKDLNFSIEVLGVE
jgi:peptidylprolyl isomerase